MRYFKYFSTKSSKWDVYFIPQFYTSVQLATFKFSIQLMSSDSLLKSTVL